MTPKRLASRDRHGAFREELRRTPRLTPAWRRVRAGLLMLQLLDKVWYTRKGRALGHHRLLAVRRAIRLVRPLVTRRMLNTIADFVVDSAKPPGEVLTALDQYGQRLVYKAEFRLAAHVYWTMIEGAERARLPEMLPRAYKRYGSCLREFNEMTAAIAAYDMGLAVAKRLRDEPAALGILIAKSGLLRLTDRHLEARVLLNEVVRRAAALNAPKLLAPAAHERGIVSHEQGKYEKALVFYADAFEAYPDVRGRIRLLGDIGRAFRELGMLDDARDALVVAFTLDRGDVYPRWTAGINLILVAVDLGSEPAFDQYRAALARAPMPARLLVAYLLEVGDGCRHFNRPADAEAAYERAARVASRQGMTERYDEVMGRLRGVISQRMPRSDRWDELPTRVQELARAIRMLRASPNLLSTRESDAQAKPQRRTQLRRGRPKKSSVS
jgi:tetratricopeptide (TPR) repeat protein